MAEKKQSLSDKGGKTTKKAVKKVAKKATKKVAKKAAPKAAVKEVEAKKSAHRYVYAVGRRKTAVVQVRLYMQPKDEKTLVNGRELKAYFGIDRLVTNALAPIKTVGMEEKVAVSLLAQGGGLSGQSDAAKLAIARALTKHDALLRPALKAAGFLTRDARSVERKKPGLKKARKSPQWSKR